jgi:hypothetical protein
LLAQKTIELIRFASVSINTIDALKAAKENGKELGKNGKRLSKRNKREADKFAAILKPIIKHLNAKGI